MEFEGAEEGRVGVQSQEQQNENEHICWTAHLQNISITVNVLLHTAGLPPVPLSSSEVSRKAQTLKNGCSPIRGELLYVCRDHALF